LRATADWTKLYLLSCGELQATHLPSDIYSKKDYHNFVKYHGLWTFNDEPPMVCYDFSIRRYGILVRGLSWQSIKTLKAQKTS